MRIALWGLLAASLIMTPAIVTPASADTMKNCAAAWKAMPAADQKKTTYKAYSSMCLKSGYKAGGGSMAMTGPAMSGPAMSGPAMSGPAMAGPKVSAQQRMKDCAAKWKALPAADKAKTTYKAYSSLCMKA
jgi:hypothetical protein